VCPKVDTCHDRSVFSALDRSRAPQSTPERVRWVQIKEFEEYKEKEKRKRIKKIRV